MFQGHAAYSEGLRAYFGVNLEGPLHEIKLG